MRVRERERMCVPVYVHTVHVCAEPFTWRKKDTATTLQVQAFFASEIHVSVVSIYSVRNHNYHFDYSATIMHHLCLTCIYFFVPSRPYTIYGTLKSNKMLPWTA